VCNHDHLLSCRCGSYASFRNELMSDALEARAMMPGEMDSHFRFTKDKQKILNFGDHRVATATQAGKKGL
jgi:hypothetical protein